MSASASGSGSAAFDQMVERLSGTNDPKRRYEYVLWLGKKLDPFPDALRQDVYKVKGCASRVYVVGELHGDRLHWQGDSDAAITKGLLALLMRGMEGLTPEQALALDPAILAATGLQASLTPSRANGFLSIFHTMQAQARQLHTG